MTPPVPSRLLLTALAARAIAVESRASVDGTETGGILFGRVVGDAIVVCHAGSSGAQAVRTPTFFLRDLQHARALADDVFDLDNSAWIGEWHTHVATAAVPSDRDLATYLQLLDDPELAFDIFVALVAVQGADGWMDPARDCVDHRLRPGVDCLR